MSLKSTNRRIRSTAGNVLLGQRRKPARPGTRQLLVEPLEDRRLLAAGVLDPTFGSGGVVTTDIGVGSFDLGGGVVVQPNGRIVVAGSSDDDFAIVRYMPDGKLDTKVTTDIGTGTSDQGNAIVLQTDGKIIVAGASNGDFALVRYMADGTLDTSFGATVPGTSKRTGKVTTDIGASDQGNAVALQFDGRILVAGGSDDDFALVCYNSDGSLWTSFGTGGKVTTPFGSTSATSDFAYAMTVQPNWQIVVAGSSGNTSKGDFALARYNANGTLDSFFGTSGNGKVTTNLRVWDDAAAIAMQPDGRIVVAGSSDGDLAVARYLNDPTVRGSDSLNDKLQLRLSTTGTNPNLEYSLNNGTWVNVGALSSIRDFTFLGLDGHDLLIVDCSRGNPIPAGGLFFNGGANNLKLNLDPTPNSLVGDALLVLGDDSPNVPGILNATYLPHGTINGVGTVQVGTGLVTFMGLDSTNGAAAVDLTRFANVAVQFPKGNDVLNVASGARVPSPATALVVSGTSGGTPFAPVALVDNTRITIDTVTGGSHGNDVITVANGNNSHGNVNITIATGGTAAGVDTDIVTFQGWLFAKGDVNVTSVNGGTILNMTFAGGGIQAANAVVLNAGAGAIATTTTPATTIFATTLTASSTKGISLDTAVTTLSVDNLGKGNVRVVNNTTANVTVKSLTTNSGGVTFMQSGGGIGFIDGPVNTKLNGAAGPIAWIQGTAGIEVTSAGRIDSPPGSGGQLKVDGATIHAGAQVTVGGGNVTILGGREDTIVFGRVFSQGTQTYTARRDVVVGGQLSTGATGAAGADINVTADSASSAPPDGNGGVYLLPSGQLNAAGAVSLSGSDLWLAVPPSPGVPPSTIDSVRIEGFGPGSVSILAVGGVTLSSGAAAPPGAAVIVGGRVESLNGNIRAQAAGRIQLGADLVATQGLIDLADDTELTNTVALNAANVKFAGTIDGPHHLTISAAAQVAFRGVIGSSIPLALLTVLTSTTTTFDARAIVDNDIAVLAGSQIIVNGQLVSTFGRIILDGGGQIQLDANLQAIHGAIQLRGGVALIGPATLIAGPQVEFDSTVDGAHALTIVAPTGIVAFYGLIGGMVPLSRLDVSASGITNFYRDVTVDGDITTSATSSTLVQRNVTSQNGNIDLNSHNGNFFHKTGAIWAKLGGVRITGRDVTVNDVIGSANVFLAPPWPPSVPPPFLIPVAIKIDYDTLIGKYVLNGKLTAVAAPGLNISIDPVDVVIGGHIVATGDIDIVASNDITVAEGAMIWADADGDGSGSLTITADNDYDDAGSLIAGANSTLRGQAVKLHGRHVQADAIFADSGDLFIDAMDGVVFRDVAPDRESAEVGRLPADRPVLSPQQTPSPGDAVVHALAFGLATAETQKSPVVAHLQESRVGNVPHDLDSLLTDDLAEDILIGWQSQA
ncbi:MAG: hypothetical protein NTY19_01240 [Planctomycetota bacterium]|nr:hypothetical protein [Planctomycetota bacterium]